jgi:hypothetical protein
MLAYGDVASITTAMKYRRCVLVYLCLRDCHLNHESLLWLKAGLYSDPCDCEPSHWPLQVQFSVHYALYSHTHTLPRLAAGTVQRTLCTILTHSHTTSSRCSLPAYSVSTVLPLLMYPPCRYSL